MHPTWVTTAPRTCARPSSVTPLAGIRAAFPGAEVRLVEADDVAAAAEAAAGADVAIVVAGYDAEDEGEYIGPDSVATPELLSLFPPIPDDMVSVLGEAFAPGEQSSGTGGDRASLSLRPVDEEIIRAVARANPSTVVASWRPAPCSPRAGAPRCPPW